jgi:ABC-2 type transport system permease protein
MINPVQPVNQGVLFQRLRWRLLHNTLQVTLQGSMLRLVIILVCSVLIWGGIFATSAEAFHYLNKQRIPLAGGILGTVFDFLFLALAILLLFSSGIILYSSLFSAAESAFLLSTPARADHVFAYKFQGAVTFSSWAFLLLGSPVLVAYGLAFATPWYYYLLVLLFFLGFVLFPGCLGALSCLLIVNFLPRHFRHVLVLALMAVVGGVMFWFYQFRPAHWGEALNRDFMQRLVGQFAVAQGPLSPNHWLSRGIQAAARGDLSKSLYFLALLWSNSLFLYLVVTFTASRLYRRCFNRVATGAAFRRLYGGAWLDRWLTRLVAFLGPQTRLLIVKDFRTFRRDPAQWAQVLIFTGLMVLYFTNMRRFYQEDIGRAYQNAVSLMNLAATAMLLCAYTGRFIYPMLSLEGRKFWILGLLPLPRERLLWGKFAFSASWSILIAEFLVVFSDVMLGMPVLIIVLHAVTMALLAAGLSGLAVGLGAWMPNFRESDPSKIAVGFGGSLNLIISLLFLLVVVSLMAVPWHIWLAWGEPLSWNLIATIWRGPFNWIVVELLGAVLATLLGTGVGVAAVVVPLRIGATALRRMEF